MSGETLKTIGIIGGGKMGSSLFRHLTTYSFNTIWLNRSNYVKEEVKYQKRMKRLLNHGLIETAFYEEKLGTVKFTASMADLSVCDIVIENISENISLKNILFSELEGHVGNNTIVLSNSSSILPDAFSVPESFQKRFAGFHLFYPVPSNKVVEIIPSNITPKDVLNKIVDFAKLIEKEPLLQNEKTAFAANRFFMEIQARLFIYCTENKIPFNKADFYIKNTLFPTGIFQVMDAIGFELLHYAVGRYMRMHEEPQQIENFYRFLESELHASLDKQVGPPVFCHDTDAIFEANDKEEIIVLNYVIELFYTFASNYVKNKLVTEDELRLIIAECTQSTFDPFEINL